MGDLCGTLAAPFSLSSEEIRCFVRYIFSVLNLWRSIGLMKRILAVLCCLCLCMTCFPAAAQTAALSGVLADDSVLTPGGNWFVEYDTTVSGDVTLTLMDKNGDVVVASDSVQPGAHMLAWDGAMPDGSWAESGFVRLMLALTAGGETHQHMVPVEILPVPEGYDAPSADEADGAMPGEPSDPEPALIITEKKPTSMSWA